MTKGKEEIHPEDVTKREMMEHPLLKEYCFQMIQIKVHLKLLKTSNLYGSPAWIACKSRYYSLVAKATNKVLELGVQENPLDVIEKLNDKLLSDSGIFINGRTIHDVSPFS